METLMFTIYFSPVTRLALEKYGNLVSEKPVGTAMCRHSLNVELKQLARKYQVQIDDFEYFKTN